MKRWASRFKLKNDVWVYVPTKEALVYGRGISKILQSKWVVPDYYYHLLAGGHIEALKVHLASKFFIRADIHRFFNSVNRSRVTRSLKRFYGYEEAREIACLSTVPFFTDGKKEYVLPFGFPQSQILASICFSDSKLGRYLDSLVRDSKLVVSIYVDDIIVSGNDEQLLKEVMGVLKQYAESSGFCFSKGKTSGPAEDFNAFNISLVDGALEITDTRMEIFRLALLAAEIDAQVLGILSYVNSVNKDQHADLLEALKL